MRRTTDSDVRNFILQKMKTVFITGASGTMGAEALTQIARTGKFLCRVLLRPKKANIRLAKKLQKNKLIEVIFGDI